MTQNQGETTETVAELPQTVANKPREFKPAILKSGALARDPRENPLCSAKSRRTGLPCRAKAMKNGKCRHHGGKSTGPRTAAGRNRSGKPGKSGRLLAKLLKRGGQAAAFEGAEIGQPILKTKQFTDSVDKVQAGDPGPEPNALNPKD